MNPLLPINAALQTIRASRVEMLLVRILGKRHVDVDRDGKTIVMKKWRKRSYLMDVRPGSKS